jgi:malate dehydrogenase (oxaloacetate-decarboxylating)
MPFQVAYARQKEEVREWILRDPNHIGLYDVVKHIKPTILIGCSTVAGAFTKEIVELMATDVERPIILPLSNPTLLSEARPEDLLKWTEGQAIIATGSPFPEVTYAGKRYRIAQSNNALAFPGIGLGIIASKATQVSDDMLWAATRALSDCSPVNQDKMAPLLPKLSEAKMVSFSVALAVANQAYEEGLAQVSDKSHLKDLIQKHVWEPRYYPYLRMNIKNE